MQMAEAATGKMTGPGTSVRVALASALGLGLLPIAPGSWGTLLGVLLHVGSALLLPAPWRIPALLAAFLLVCLLHYALTPWAQRYWGGADPKNFVLDEVAGYLLVPILFRHGALWQVALWGFVCFRVLDVIKLPPARQIDRNTRGAGGILLDDLVSAGYAVLALYLLKWVGPYLGASEWLISSVRG
jgi:phosphatidylglycerophosphatase A